MELRLVVRYLNGRIAKGTTINFNPNSPSFHMTPAAGPGATASLIPLNELKAVFFVRTFEGNRRHEERKSFQPGDPFQGRRMKVTFVDGEVMVGSSPSYAPGGPGFFLFPVDADTNTIKAFVPAGSVRNVEFLSG